MTTAQSDPESCLQARAGLTTIDSEFRSKLQFAPDGSSEVGFLSWIVLSV